MGRMITRLLARAIVCAWLAAGSVALAAAPGDRVQNKQAVHRFSTLFSAQDVRDRLATDRDIDQALEWCRHNGVSRAYVESFRDGYRAPRERLVHARDRLRAAGLDVSGCITTTRLGKPSTGWKGIACLTDAANQKRLRAEFEYAAALFDEIMIDDFWFTDCTCPACDAARGAKTVKIGAETFPVEGDTWEDYRGELMLQLSRRNVLEAARKVNARVRVIIKYPLWYEDFHKRGYDVVRESAAFDRTWVGTEFRDYRDRQWGGTPAFHAYFLMRWLGGIGGEKCGGGWFDPYGTSPKTYVEQARQTVLGGGRESLLFCYGSLVHGNGPANLAALRAAQPELLETAAQVGKRQPVGVAAYRPINTSPGREAGVFDFVGMAGVPLVPCHEFPTEAPALFLSVHAQKDPELATKLAAFAATGRPVLITDGLARHLKRSVPDRASNVHVLPVKGEPKSLLELPQGTLDALRGPLLEPLSRRFEAPNRVALYLFSDRSWVIENFNDDPVTVTLDSRQYRIEPRAWRQHWVTAPDPGPARKTARSPDRDVRGAGAALDEAKKVLTSSRPSRCVNHGRELPLAPVRPPRDLAASAEPGARARVGCSARPFSG
jgi:hypothetical protein